MKKDILTEKPPGVDIKTELEYLAKKKCKKIYLCR